MYLDALTELGLSKNEAQIYESLVKNGGSSVSFISKDTNIHRRNIYDTLNHLINKGLVFEKLSGKENKYHAVEPVKLRERIKEKEIILDKVLPSLERLYKSSPTKEAVYIYKGIEGWKNYLGDVLEVGEDVYTIGGKGSWGDEKIDPFFETFLKEAKKKNINFHILFDGDKEDIPKKVLDLSVGKQKFLPKKYSNSSIIDIFGDRVVTISNTENRKIDNNATLTVIINKDVADSYRTWFQMIWDLLP